MTNKFSDKDHAILKLIARARYITTRQIVSLFFRDSQHTRTASRRANLILNKLKSHGFIAHLERRIGGVRAGSGSFVWYILPKGLRHLGLPIRHRNKYEPTAHHLEHTLAVTQVYTQLKTLALEGKIQLEEFDFEPLCHRSYATFTGRAVHLKPDGFTCLLVDQFEDSYFLEIDQATESLNRVINQYKKYIAYFQTGIEQRERGIFPLVLWIVPHDKRKQAIQEKIAHELDGFWQMFQVITLDEFNIWIQGERNEN